MAINLDHSGAALVTLRSAAATLDIDTSIVVTGQVTATQFNGPLNGTANKVANALSFSSTGNGDIAGSTFDGSSARIISYNSIGAAATSGTNATGTWSISISGSAATLTTARTIASTGDATWSVSFDGSANVSSALTLATVNASPVTDSFRKVTVNGKGLVTATSAVASSDITTALGFTPVNKAGDTFTGAVTVPLLNVDTNAAFGSANLTTTSTTQVALASFVAATYGSGEFLIQATQGVNRQITKLLVVHNGTIASATEFGTILTSTRFFNVEVDINSGNVRVLITPTSTTSTVFKTSFSLVTS